MCCISGLCVNGNYLGKLVDRFMDIYNVMIHKSGQDQC